MIPYGHPLLCDVFYDSMAFKYVIDLLKLGISVIREEKIDSFILFITLLFYTFFKEEIDSRKLQGIVLDPFKISVCYGTTFYLHLLSSCSRKNVISTS